MKIFNDNSCGWLTNLQPRKNFKILNQNQKCDYLIVGAGYTGLSAARKLSEINSSKKIIIVDTAFNKTNPTIHTAVMGFI